MCGVAVGARCAQFSDDGDLLDKMSPMLQGTVALAANRKWLNHVWFFRDIDTIDGGSGTRLAPSNRADGWPERMHAPCDRTGAGNLTSTGRAASLGRLPDLQSRFGWPID